MNAGLAAVKRDYTLIRSARDDDRDRVIQERLSKRDREEHRTDAPRIFSSGLPVGEPLQFEVSDVATLLKTDVNRIEVNPIRGVRDVVGVRVIEPDFHRGSRAGRVDQWNAPGGYLFGDVEGSAGKDLLTRPTKPDDDWQVTVPSVTLPSHSTLPHEILYELATVQETARKEGCPAPPPETVNDARNLVHRMYAHTPFPYDVTPDGEGGLAIQALGNGISILVILSPDEHDQCYVSLDEENRRSIYGKRSKVFGRFLRTALRDLRDADKTP